MTASRTTSTAIAPIETAPRPLVLIVDDDPAQLDLSRMLAARAGFSVMTAAGASEALSAARARRPDAIISDVLMHELDGFTLCGLFRREPALRDVPIVLASAYFNSEEDRKLAISAGAARIVERTPMFEAELAALRRSIEDGAPPFVEQAPLPDLYVRTMANRLAEFLAQTRAAELRYRTLLDQANEAIAVLSSDGVILEVNRRWEDIRQLPREQLVGQHISEAAPPGHEDANVEHYRRTVGDRTGRSSGIPILRADGSTIYMDFSTAAVDIDGESLIFSVGRDVTETVEATRKLKASEEKYRSLIENVPDVVWVATEDGQVTFVSPRVEAVCGFTPEEVTSAGASFWFDRVHPEDVARVREVYAGLARGGFEAEYRWQRQDGQWIWIRARAVAAIHEHGVILAEGTFADVTSQKRLEDQVRQSQKMEAVGQLTGGIAHDFNNLLAIILGNGRMLLEDLETGDPRRADAEAVVEAGERAAALTRQLLSFSRRQVLQPKCLSLNSIVSGIEKMLRRVIGEDIDVSIALADDDAATIADAGEIEQVIMNLAVNARDAMPGGGVLSIETAVVELDAEYAAAHAGVTPGRYVMLSVTDTGCGMDAETRQRAFEPFYTTKENGRGTGLGLSTCYGIVTQSKGHLAIYSELGRGTAVKVYLPRVDATGETSEPSTSAGRSLRGTETILIVEDDNRLRSTIRRILESRGYTVLAASDGPEAIAISEAHRGALHLVLSDMVMPGLSGADTLAEVMRRRPDIRMLLMSGYSDHALLRGGAIKPGLNFLQKPFAPQVLAAKIREVLDA